MLNPPPRAPLQETLESELRTVMDAYKPKFKLTMNSASEKILEVVSTLLEGGYPDMQDLLFIQKTVTSNEDIYAPVTLDAQIEDQGMEVRAAASCCLCHGARSLARLLCLCAACCVRCLFAGWVLSLLVAAY